MDDCSDDESQSYLVARLVDARGTNVGHAAHFGGGFGDWLGVVELRKRGAVRCSDDEWIGMSLRR